MVIIISGHQRPSVLLAPLLILGAALTLDFAKQVDDSLHEDDDRHESDSIIRARAAQQTVGQRVDRLLGHPGLAGARAGAHEGRLCRVRAGGAVGRWHEIELDEIEHVLDLPLRWNGAAVVLRIRRGRDVQRLVLDAQIVTGDRVLDEGLAHHNVLEVVGTGSFVLSESGALW